MTICTEFINYNNKLYTIYRKLKSGRVKEEYLNEIKEFWGCDLVLKSKKQEQIEVLFLREVEDAKLAD